MTIKILGSGCAKCRQLEENAKKALEAAGIGAVVEKVTDMDKIMDYGVMMTPAIVIDEEIKAAGRLLTVDEIRKLF